MDNDNNFKYDPEDELESNAKKYRLPFALSKRRVFKCKIGGVRVTLGKLYSVVDT